MSRNHRLPRRNNGLHRVVRAAVAAVTLLLIAAFGLSLTEPAGASSTIPPPSAPAVHTLRVDNALTTTWTRQQDTATPYLIHEVVCNTTGDGVCWFYHGLGARPSFVGVTPLVRYGGRPFVIVVDPDLTDADYVHLRLWNMVDGQWQHRAYSNSKFTLGIWPGCCAS